VTVAAAQELMEQAYRAAGYGRREAARMAAEEAARARRVAKAAPKKSR
jgi:hypothetical protein